VKKGRVSQCAPLGSPPAVPLSRLAPRLGCKSGGSFERNIQIGTVVRPPATNHSPHLANAARLIEGKPALATLRFLQTLEASNAGQTFVINDISAPLPALTLHGATLSAPEPGET